jgi:hypothetical protein
VVGADRILVQKNSQVPRTSTRLIEVVPIGRTLAGASKKPERDLESSVGALKTMMGQDFLESRVRLCRHWWSLEFRQIKFGLRVERVAIESCLAIEVVNVLRKLVARLFRPG